MASRSALLLRLVQYFSKSFSCGVFFWSSSFRCFWEISSIREVWLVDGSDRCLVYDFPSVLRIFRTSCLFKLCSFRHKRA
jgi:hypothetical protein